MTSMRALVTALHTAALALWAAPALALAQGTAQPGSAPAPMDAGRSTGGGSGWLWIIAALIVLAIVWWAMSSRRRHGTITR